MQRLPLSMIGESSRRRPGVCRDDRDRDPSGAFEITVSFRRRSGDPRRPRRRRRARGADARRDVGRARRPRPSTPGPRLRRSRLHGRGRPRSHRQELGTPGGVEPRAHPARGISSDPADPRHHRAERARSDSRRPIRASPPWAPRNVPDRPLAVARKRSRSPRRPGTSRLEAQQTRRSTPRSVSSPAGRQRPSRAPTASASPSSGTAVWRRWHRPTTPCC